MLTEIIYLLVAFIITAILGKFIIPVLKKLKVGQSERLDGPRTHLKKQGTPTMGGIMMVITIIILVAICAIINKNLANIKPLYYCNTYTCLYRLLSGQLQRHQRISGRKHTGQPGYHTANPAEVKVGRICPRVERPHWQYNAC